MQAFGRVTKFSAWLSRCCRQCGTWLFEPALSIRASLHTHFLHASSFAGFHYGDRAYCTHLQHVQRRSANEHERQRERVHSLLFFLRCCFGSRQEHTVTHRWMMGREEAILQIMLVSGEPHHNNHDMSHTQTDRESTPIRAVPSRGDYVRRKEGRERADSAKMLGSRAQSIPEHLKSERIPIPYLVGPFL